MDNNKNFPWVKNYPDGIQWHEEIPVFPVYEMLDQTAEKYGDSPAFDFFGRKTKLVRHK